MFNSSCSRFAVAILFSIPLAVATAITGTVKDPSSRVIAGAEVSVQSPAIPGPRVVKTDSQGRFSFDDLPAGVYIVSSSFEGFEGFEAAQQTVSLADQPVTLVFELKIAPQETTVEVAGKRSALDGEATGSYRIDNLVLKRDTGVFTFRSGHFSFLPAVGSRVS